MFSSACSVVLGSIHIVVLGSADRNMPSHSLYLVSLEWQQSSLIFLFILSFLVMMVAMMVLVASCNDYIQAAM